MPTLGGREVLTPLKKNDILTNVPIIFMTCSSFHGRWNEQRRKICILSRQANDHRGDQENDRDIK